MSVRLRLHQQPRGVAPAQARGFVVVRAADQSIAVKADPDLLVRQQLGGGQEGLLILPALEVDDMGAAFVAIILFYPQQFLGGHGAHALG